MKKLILLALVALVAGAAFGMTAPAFSGSFEFSTTMDFSTDSYIIGATNDAVVDLNGVVSDWATVTAELGVSEPDLEDGFTDNIVLNQFNLETDITGAFGGGDLGVMVAWGLVSHEAAEYNNVAGYEDVEPTSETDSYWGVRLTISILEKVKIIVLVPPSTYTDWTIRYGEGGAAQPGFEPVFSGEIQFLQLIDGLDLNIWYTNDSNDGDDTLPGIQVIANEIGFTAGYVMGDVKIGALLKNDFELETLGAGIAVQYTIDAWTGGAVVGFPDFSDLTGTDPAFAGINLTFAAAPDILDIYAAVKFPFGDFSNSWGVDAGIDLMIAGVDYYIGYDYQGAGFKSPNGNGLYVSVKADF